MSLSASWGARKLLSSSLLITIRVHCSRHLKCIQICSLPSETSRLGLAQTKGCWYNAPADCWSPTWGGIYRSSPVKGLFCMCTFEWVGKTNSADFRRPDSLQTSTVQLSRPPCEGSSVLALNTPIIPLHLLPVGLVTMDIFEQLNSSLSYTWHHYRLQGSYRV